MDLKSFIEENLLRSNGRCLNVYRSRHQGLWTLENFPKVFTEIVKRTEFLENPTFNQRLYHVFNGIFEAPLCKTCKTKKTTFKGFQYGYQEFCSNKCSIKHEDTLQKYRQTCLEKYGESIPQRTEIVKQKAKETCLEKYGNTYPFASSIAQEKFKNTCLEKYGEPHHFRSKEIQEKRKQTCLEKYGVDNYRKSSEHISKTKERNKVNRAESLWPRLIKSMQEHNCTLLTEPAEFIKDIEFVCDKGHLNATQLCNWWRDLRCGKCSGNGTSNAEQEVYSFVSEYVNAVNGSRKVISPRQLDIYIPEDNLAIEFNGIYYHSELRGTDPKYHLNKTEECKSKGIELIHVFEDEWLYKQEIVKSILLNKFNKIENKIYARKCSIKEVDCKTKDKFLEENHIQGTCVSSTSLGLFYEEGLVSIMTFGKRKITGESPKTEMLRFCNKIYTSVVGGADRLFKHYVKEYSPEEEVVSYADRRWFSGKMYETLGFELDHVSGPNYWYIVQGHREHRVKYQKHKLSSLLENFNSTKTEWQNMQDHGFNRIWDCGNLVYKWRK